MTSNREDTTKHILHPAVLVLFPPDGVLTQHKVPMDRTVDRMAHTMVPDTDLDMALAITHHHGERHVLDSSRPFWRRWRAAVVSI